MREAALVNHQRHAEAQAILERTDERTDERHQAVIEAIQALRAP
jgi:hypothetical protein